MKKINPAISTIGAYTLVFAASAILLVAPCGPGCDWPAHVVTTTYSLGIIVFRYKDPLVRKTGFILLLVSIAFLSISLYNRNQFQSRMLERIQEIKRQAIETQPEENFNTEQ
jgi:hypothetical protein